MSKNIRVGSRKTYLEAPYGSDVYRRRLISTGRRLGVHFASFDAPAALPRFRGRVFVRHDIDFQGCVENAPILLDIDVSLQIPSSSFIRVDGIDYRPETCVDIVRDYKREGLQFGLHSSCYVANDYMTCLQNEIETFADVFRFRPKWITVHGMGSVRLQERRQFVQELGEALPIFGITVTDCVTSCRRYSREIQDCHVLNGLRYMKRDFDPDYFRFRRGDDTLVLTHPSYWVASESTD